MKKETQFIPYIPQPVYEEDEIDLKEIISTILKYKKFIIIFTFIITLLAGIYAFTQKPVYEVNANIQLGYIDNNNNKIYLTDTQATSIYIKNKFDKSCDINTTYPKVKVTTIKKTNNILNISVQDFSNKSAVTYLNNIIKTLKQKENTKLSSYIKNIQKQINILNNQINDIKKEITLLNNHLTKIKDTNIYQITLNKINDYQNQITNTKLQIASLKSKISPLNINQTSIIGTIKQKPYPIKPKKKLIITVAFITGLILSIFLVFFIEFIKTLREE
jgi:uncharacterized protein involved in exopolysaccharide biosynthesis